MFEVHFLSMEVSSENVSQYSKVVYATQNVNLSCLLGEKPNWKFQIPWNEFQMDFFSMDAISEPGNSEYHFIFFIKQFASVHGRHFECKDTIIKLVLATWKYKIMAWSI